MSSAGPGALGSELLSLEVERFIIREAQLLDGQRFDEWFALLDERIIYFVPNFSEDAEPEPGGVVVREDYQGLRARVARIAHRQNPTRRPPARTLHAVTNIFVESVSETGTVVSSNLVYYVSKDRRMLAYPARVVHELVRSGNDWRIRAKTITLLINDLALGQLTLI